MNSQLKEIADRLRGLREALDLSPAQVAAKCNISTEEYLLFESGNSDIPMSFLFQMAQSYGLSTAELLSGLQAHASSFFVTRKGTGISVERTKAYKYQALASGFKGNRVEPFEVTVEPNNNPITLNSHTGQEFNLILKGTMLLSIAGHDIVLNEGDSIYFDAVKPHGMKALNDEKVVFLAVII